MTLTYNWFYNGSAINGSQSNVYAATSAGNYNVTISAGSCSFSSQTVGGNVLPAPVAPVITLVNDTFFSNITHDVEWLLNGTLLSQQTGSFCLPYGPGYYTCQAVNTNHCSAGSNTIAYEVAGVTNLAEQHITLYPNPANDEFAINFGQPFTGVIKVINVAGQGVQQQMVNSVATAQINVATLPAGLYTLMLNAGDGTRVTKFVVVH